MKYVIVYRPDISTYPWTLYQNLNISDSVLDDVKLGNKLHIFSQWHEAKEKLFELCREEKEAEEKKKPLAKLKKAVTEFIDNYIKEHE